MIDSVPFEIVSTEKVGEVSWSQYVLNTPQSTIYHTPEWSKIICETFGLSSYHLFAVSADNILGFLPLFTRCGKVLTSSPFRDRGGLLANTPEIGRRLLEAANLTGVDLKSGYVEVKQYFPGHEDLFAETGYHPMNYWVGSVIDLPDEPETLWQAIDNKVRGKVRQATQNDLHLEISSSKEAFKTFHEMFWRTRRSLGVPAYSRKFFEAIASILCPKNMAHFFFASHKKNQLAAILVFAFNGVVIDAYAASNIKYLAMRPNDFLVWEVIKWSIQNKYRYFDFGVDSPELIDLLRFKAKWRAKQDVVPHYYYEASPGSARPQPDLGKGVMGKLSRTIFPRLPGFLYKNLSRLAVEFLTRRI